MASRRTFGCFFFCHAKKRKSNELWTRKEEREWNITVPNYPTLKRNPYRFSMKIWIELALPERPRLAHAFAVSRVRCFQFFWRFSHEMKVWVSCGGQGCLRHLYRCLQCCQNYHLIWHVMTHGYHWLRPWHWPLLSMIVSSLKWRFATGHLPLSLEHYDAWVTFCYFSAVL